MVRNKYPYYLDLTEKLVKNDDRNIIDLFKANTNETEETLRDVFNPLKYTFEDYIHNYTKESFYYKNLNKFLREGNFYCFRILSNHISKFMYWLNKRREIHLRRGNLPSILYRNTCFSPKDFNVYKESVGSVICYPSFTSTSLNHNFVLIQTNINYLFIRLIIYPNNSNSIVNIREYSEYPGEEEYLFLPFSFFKIKYIEPRFGSREDPHLIHLIALDSEKTIEDIFIDFMENETDNLDPEGLDLFILTNNDTKIILNQQLISVRTYR